jgi:hypothetical protein
MGTTYNLKSQSNHMNASVAEKIIEWTGNSNHTSGDVRLLYMTLNLRGAAGDGEVLRPRTIVYGTGINSAHGQHCTLQIAVGGAIAGLGAGLRATFEAAAETRTLGGTLCALQVDSNIATGNTLPGSHSFIRIANNGAVSMTNLFELPAPSNGTIFATHTTDAMTHSVKILSNGTAYYLMATSTDTNRGA